MKAILLYRLGREIKKPFVKAAHGILLLSSLIFAGVALGAVFRSNNLANPPRKNLTSLHSWLGLTIVILFGIQWLLGLITFLFPGLSQSMRQTYMPT